MAFFLFFSRGFDTCRTVGLWANSPESVNRLYMCECGDCFMYGDYISDRQTVCLDLFAVPANRQEVQICMWLLAAPTAHRIWSVAS
jgi:hypothetical protein